MGLRHARPPKAHAETLGSHLARVLGRPDRARILRRDVDDVKEVETARPHPVYTVPIDSLAAGRGLADARLVSWRTLVRSGADVLAAVELAPEEADAERLSFAGLHRSRFDGATARALVAALRHKWMEERDFELRLLRVPALFLAALWLHAEEAPDQDLLVPLEDHPGGLTELEVYRVEEIRDVLERLARERQEGIAQERELMDGYEKEAEAPGPPKD